MPSIRNTHDCLSSLLLIYNSDRTTITAIEKPVDLAVIATPAKTIHEFIRACGEQGVRAVIVISSGFGEGKSHLSNLTSSLDKTVLEVARQYQGIYK